MTINPLDVMDPRILATRIRESREACGWTQQQLADRMGVANPMILEIENGERRLRPRELVELASVLGRSVSELLQPQDGIFRRIAAANDESRVTLAIEAWQEGELSEGQLARVLGTDRLGARELIRRFEDRQDQGSPDQ